MDRLLVELPTTEHWWALKRYVENLIEKYTRKAMSVETLEGPRHDAIVRADELRKLIIDLELFRKRVLTQEALDE